MISKLKNFSYHLKTETQNKINSVKSRLLQFFWDLPTLDIEDIVKGDIQIETPILDDICLPPYYGPQDHDDFTPLMKIVQYFQPQILLELGTAYGNMTANICRQCPHTKIFTINAPIEKQTGIVITYNLTEEEIGRAYKKNGFSSQVTQILENTLHLNLTPYLKDSTVDIGIVDACHDTEYVLNDFSKIAPFIRRGGIILLHDTHPSMANHLIGSYTACMLLRKKGYDIKHIQNTWWGIWKKNLD